MAASDNLGRQFGEFVPSPEDLQQDSTYPTYSSAEAISARKQKGAVNKVGAEYRLTKMSRPDTGNYHAVANTQFLTGERN